MNYILIIFGALIIIGFILTFYDRKKYSKNKYAKKLILAGSVLIGIGFIGYCLLELFT